VRLPNAKLVRAFRRIHRCEMPGCYRVDGLQVHHEPTWGSAHQEGRLTLCRICVWCHDRLHRQGDDSPIIGLICRREGCSEDDRAAVVNLLKRAPFKSQADARRPWFEWQASEWPESALGLLAKTLTEAGIR
jgi:hypothetical protein